MAANAEVIISPEVSRRDLKKSMDRIEKAMKQTAKKSGNHFTDALKKSGADAGSKFGAAFKSKLGLAGIVTAVAGAVFSGLDIAQAQAAKTRGAIESILGDKDASTSLAFAKGQGFTNQEISAFNSRVGRAGGDEQTGRDFIVDTSEYIAQARAGENDLLAQFTHLKGPEQFNAIIASLAGRKPDDINKFLADIGWAGDADVIFNMLNELGGKTGNAAYTHLNKISEQDKQNALLLEKEGALEKKFNEMIRNANINVKSGLLENFGDAELKEYQKGLEQQMQAELDAVKNYQVNQQIANDTEAARKEVYDTLLGFFHWLYSFKSTIEGAFKNLSEWGLFSSPLKTDTGLKDSAADITEKAAAERKAQGLSLWNTPNASSWDKYK